MITERVIRYARIDCGVSGIGRFRFSFSTAVQQIALPQCFRGPIAICFYFCAVPLGTDRNI